MIIYLCGHQTETEETSKVCFKPGSCPSCLDDLGLPGGYTEQDLEDNPYNDPDSGYLDTSITSI